ncbi:heme NO-binding domain-containing protein [Altericroceibacterium endophyticum]|uniref:Guanylate cyclase n=1 Tax=Altericroceibacterium endophyticum TaxID=1808508 RepID=A0A6I4T6R3_9SPHN|nr:heme NO-binding domain-containing protein [Altericroceibacterium endophyticum]MXO66348.1 guanylate cyclase [Altericroceibacterium endophyticum]
MKGIIFTELLGFIEAKAGMVFAEQVLEKANLPNDAAFTTVGLYPSHYATSLVSAASELSGIPADKLCREYGEFLFDRFTKLYANLLAAYSTADALLTHVNTHIHEEVKLLYPDAVPPCVTARKEGDVLVIEYQSHRPFAHIAYGLVSGALSHYGDTRCLEWVDDNQSDHATFRIVS